MKIEQKITVLFLIFGIVLGIVSDYLVKVYGALFAIILPLIAYFILLLFSKKFVKEKKFVWLFYNSLITFILVWLVVWLSLYQM